MTYEEQLKVNYHNNKQKLWIKVYMNALSQGVEPTLSHSIANDAVLSFTERFLTDEVD